MGWIIERLASFGARQAVAGVTYFAFLERIARARTALDAWGIAPGERVGFAAGCHDHHADALAWLMALLDAGCIVVPLDADDHARFDERLATAGASRLITVTAGSAFDQQSAQCVSLPEPGTPHALLAQLAEQGRAGFVIFTSGSTGGSKAVLLDFERMTRRHRDGGRVRPRGGYRTLLFLKLDHIGGLNTLLSVLFNGGTVVTCATRDVRAVCACVEAHAVQLLPTTPSFLTMLLMSRACDEYDLSSLETVTYGTEVMPASTLARLHRVLPNVTFKQTYGLSELGILSTQSKDSSSTWMKIGGTGVELAVRDGVLWVRADAAMLGYLNAPNPFDAHGWYNTGDRVEVEGDYYRILGRASEVINVAGEKVFPAEIESFLLTLDNVKDVVVRQKRSPVVGQMVWAEFVLERDEDPAALKRRVTEQCEAHLSAFKVPGHITIARQGSLVGARLKKIRSSSSSSDSDSDAAAPLARDASEATP